MAWVLLFDELDGVSMVNADTIAGITSAGPSVTRAQLPSYADFSHVDFGHRTLIVLGTPDEVALNIVDQCDTLGDLADSYGKRLDVMMHRRSERLTELKEAAKTEGGG